MGDIENQIVNDDYEKKSRIRLFTRTILHVAYCGINLSVSLYGVLSFFTIDKSTLNNPEVLALKKYIMFFFTNWNYVSKYFFINIYFI